VLLRSTRGRRVRLREGCDDRQVQEPGSGDGEDNELYRTLDGGETWQWMR
jgi:hypothetical protein